MSSTHCSSTSSLLFPVGKGSSLSLQREMDASQLKITASKMRCRVAGPTQSSVEDDSSPRENCCPHTNERATALSKLALVKSKIG